MIINSLYAFLATLFFAILFNISGKKLFYSALCGGLGWFIYILTLKYSHSDLLSYFAASMFIGLYSEILARIIKTPATCFSICGIIPLVPGSGMYYTMLQSVQGNIEKSLSTGLNTIFIAGDIALGILVSTSLLKLFIYKNKNL